MNRENQNSIKKTILYSAATIIFVFVVIMIMSSWGKEETLTENKAPAVIADDKAGQQSGNKTGINDNTPDVDTEPVDPRLRKISIVEIPQEIEEEDTPEEKEHKRILSVIKRPMNDLLNELSSFVYEGEMTMTMPVFNNDEASFKAGQRFGESEVVVSKFTYIKDENGNSRIIQSTDSASEREKYKENKYNGELTWRDGQYSYSDAGGNSLGKDDVDQMVAENTKNNGETFVRNNWMKLVQDIDNVIAFEKGDAGDGGQQYDIVSANPELQKKTREITALDGSLTLDEENGIMTGSSIAGSAKLHDGFMTGADVSFSITMTLKEIGSVADVNDY